MLQGEVKLLLSLKSLMYFFVFQINKKIYKTQLMNSPHELANCPHSNNFYQSTYKYVNLSLYRN